MTGTQEIIYIGDPMCSWCWAIAPELDELRRRLPDVPFSVVTGGLRPGPEARMISDEMAEYLAGEWSRIQERTGQPFDHTLLERRDWLYDTEPACRAVAVMGKLDKPRAWPLFKRLQRAFYAEGVLLTEPDAYPELVKDVGGDPEPFMELYNSDEGKAAAWSDFAQAREWGVTSFPTVVARVDEGGHLLTIGYTTAGVMMDRLPQSTATSTADPGVNA